MRKLRGGVFLLGECCRAGIFNRVGDMGTGATLGTACVEFIQTGEEKIMHGGVKIFFLRLEKNFRISAQNF
jgi:hypothetical protein